MVESYTRKGMTREDAQVRPAVAVVVSVNCPGFLSQLSPVRRVHRKGRREGILRVCLRDGLSRVSGFFSPASLSRSPRSSGVLLGMVKQLLLKGCFMIVAGSGTRFFAIFVSGLDAHRSGLGISGAFIPARGTCRAVQHEQHCVCSEDTGFP